MTGCGPTRNHRGGGWLAGGSGSDGTHNNNGPDTRQSLPSGGQIDGMEAEARGEGMGKPFTLMRESTHPATL